MKRSYVTLLVCSALAGCGKAPAPTPAPAPRPAPAPTNAPVAAIPPAPTPLVPVPPKVDAPAGPLSEFEKALGAVLALERDAEFAQALLECRKLRSRADTAAERTALDETLTRLTEEKRNAIGLPFAIDNLGSLDAAAVHAAERKLLLADTAGLVYLRKALREKPDAVAVNAARLLADKDDAGMVPIVVQRIALNPASPAIPKFAVFLRKFLPGIEQQELALLFTLLDNDPEFQRREVAGLLCAVLQQTGKDRKDLFDQRVGNHEATAQLKQYVERALLSDNAVASRWAATHAPLFDLAVFGFLKRDPQPRGTWRDILGKTGASIVGDKDRLPESVTLKIEGANVHTWAGSSEDPRAVQRIEGDQRIAACWYADKSITFTLTFKDPVPHQVAVYLIDWDRLGRKATVELLDGKQKIIDTQQVETYGDGLWLFYTLTGSAVIRLTNTGPHNVTVGAVLID